MVVGDVESWWYHRRFEPQHVDVRVGLGDDVSHAIVSDGREPRATFDRVDQRIELLH